MRTSSTKGNQLRELLLFVFFPFTGYLFCKKGSLSRLSFLALVLLIFYLIFIYFLSIDDSFELQKDVDDLIILFLSLGAAAGLLEGYIASVGRRIRSRPILYVLLYCWCMILAFFKFLPESIGGFGVELQMIAGLDPEFEILRWVGIFLCASVLVGQIPLVFGKNGVMHKAD